MCKIMVIPTIAGNLKTQKNMWKFAIASQPYMNKNDVDGFGFMYVGENGLFTEKWLNPKDSFRMRNKIAPRDKALADKFLGFVNANQEYDTTGKPSDTVRAMALHSRMATCGVNIQNTHPFVNGNTALIHNGVVSKIGLEFKSSSCDSEGILNEYTKCNVAASPANIDEVTYALEGYYACAVFAKDKANRWVLDVFKDDKASLSALFVHELNTMVFVTDADIVRNTCKTLKWKAPSVMRVKDNCYIRFDVETGEAVHCQDINEYISAIDVSELKRDILTESKMTERLAAIGDDDSGPFYVKGEGYAG